MQMVIEPLFRLLLLSSSDSERNLHDGAPKSCPFMCCDKTCTIFRVVTSALQRVSRVTPVKRGKVALPTLHINRRADAVTHGAHSTAPRCPQHRT